MCDICNGQTLEDFRRELLADVARDDFSVVGVEAEHSQSTGELVEPSFVYSVGLWCMRKLPELVVMGVPPGERKPVELYLQRMSHGERFSPGVPYDGFVRGRPVIFERVAPALYDDWLSM